jgi:hypothetical protein
MEGNEHTSFWKIVCAIIAVIICARDGTLCMGSCCGGEKVGERRKGRLDRMWHLHLASPEFVSGC